MLAKVHTISLLGIEAIPVDVEVDVSAAVSPKTILVGLPAAAVKESTHRVLAAKSIPECLPSCLDLGSSRKLPNGRVRSGLFANCDATARSRRAPRPRRSPAPAFSQWHTYFVGEKQMLVHHMSMLSTLDGGSSVVPGL
jgi:hypothetical protein